MYKRLQINDLKLRLYGLSVFRERFHPGQSIVVGPGGIPVEEFLRWDIGNLLE